MAGFASSLLHGKKTSFSLLVHWDADLGTQSGIVVSTYSRFYSCCQLGTLQWQSGTITRKRSNEPVLMHSVSASLSFARQRKKNGSLRFIWGMLSYRRKQVLKLSPRQLLTAYLEKLMGKRDIIRFSSNKTNN